jgi:hypothetical protein
MTTLFDIPRDPFQLILKGLDNLSVIAFSMVSRDAQWITAKQWTKRGRALMGLLCASGKVRKAKGALRNRRERWEHVLTEHGSYRAFVVHYEFARLRWEKEWSAEEHKFFLAALNALIRIHSHAECPVGIANGNPTTYTCRTRPYDFFVASNGHIMSVKRIAYSFHETFNGVSMDFRCSCNLCRVSVAVQAKSMLVIRRRVEYYNSDGEFMWDVVPVSLKLIGWD